MIPAHSAASQSPAGATGQFHIDAQSDGAGHDYADVSKHIVIGERQLTDRSLVTFDHANMAVVPDRLMTLDARYGMSPVPELSALMPGCGSHVNMTLLPHARLGQPVLQFASPGKADGAMAELRSAKLGCALLEKQVGHVVTVSQTGMNGKVLNEAFEARVNGRGGPLNIGMKTGEATGPAPRSLEVAATLPSGVREESGRIGLWEVDLGAPVEVLGNTFKALHDASAGEAVAFGCQSGNTRSGAAAMLYFQRAIAEDTAKRGREPTVSALMADTQKWASDCKGIRSQHFADKMPPKLLEAHAAWLVAEFKQRAEATPTLPQRPPTPTRKPPLLPAKPLMRPAAQGPVVPPKSARAPVKAAPPPLPAKPPMGPRAESSQDLSIYSMGTVRASWGNERPTAVVPPFENTPTSQGAEVYAHLNRHERSGPEKNIYGMGSASEAAADGVHYTSVELGPTEGGHRGSDLSTSTAYSEAWDLPKPGGEWNADRLRRSSLRLGKQLRNEDISPTGSTSARAGKGPDEPWARWATATHPQSKNLDAFLTSIGEDFCQPAPQGFRLFANKKTYGAGKGVENVKSQAGNRVWSALAEALHVTAERSTDLGDTSGSLMRAMFKSKLQQYFDTLSPQLQKKWVDRSKSKGMLEAAVQTAQTELTNLDTLLKASNADLNDIKDRLLGTEMTYAALRAVHEIGQTNGR